MTLIFVIIVALILYVVLAYNTMVKMRNHVKEAWSDIDVQLKRRYNLIPNIVESVKGYAAHEEGVFTKVTEARANAINATNVKEQGAAENMLSGALKSLFAVAEDYPDLKANENFLQLQNELVDTEDKIQSARRFYNGNVRDFNTKIQQFPAKVIANVFKFISEEFFEIENDEEKKVVDVSFDKKKEEAPVEEKKPSEDTPIKEPTEEPKEEEKPAEEPKPEPAEGGEAIEPEVEKEKEEEPKEEEKPAEEPEPEPKEEEKPAEEPTPEPEAPAESEEEKKEGE
jgi:LemA protein